MLVYESKQSYLLTIQGHSALRDKANLYSLCEHKEDLAYPNLNNVCILVIVQAYKIMIRFNWKPVSFSLWRFAFFGQI